MDIRKVIDNPARYMKYLKGEYKSRYKDSIFLKEVGSRVMYIDIDIYQLAEHDITLSQPQKPFISYMLLILHWKFTLNLL